MQEIVLRGSIKILQTFKTGSCVLHICLPCKAVSCFPPPTPCPPHSGVWIGPLQKQPSESHERTGIRAVEPSRLVRATKCTFKKNDTRRLIGKHDWRKSSSFVKQPTSFRPRRPAVGFKSKREERKFGTESQVVHS